MNILIFVILNLNLKNFSCQACQEKMHRFASSAHGGNLVSWGNKLVAIFYLCIMAFSNVIHILSWSSSSLVRFGAFSAAEDSSSSVTALLSSLIWEIIFWAVANCEDLQPLLQCLLSWNICSHQSTCWINAVLIFIIFIQQLVTNVAWPKLFG